MLDLVSFSARVGSTKAPSRIRGWQICAIWFGRLSTDCVFFFFAKRGNGIINSWGNVRAMGADTRPCLWGSRSKETVCYRCKCNMKAVAVFWCVCVWGGGESWTLLLLLRGCANVIHIDRIGWVAALLKRHRVDKSMHFWWFVIICIYFDMLRKASASHITAPPYILNRKYLSSALILVVSNKWCQRSNTNRMPNDNVTIHSDYLRVFRLTLANPFEGKYRVIWSNEKD